MSEKQLYTLKEIADELGVNYKTLFAYKDVFQEFMVIQLQGMKVKYLPENIDIFTRILVLREEGLGFEDIIKALKSNEPEGMGGNRSVDLSVGRSIDRSVDLSVCPSVDPSVCRSVDRSVGLSIDRSIDRSVGLSIDRSVDISEEQESGLNDSERDEDDQDHIETAVDKSVVVPETQPEPIPSTKPGPDLEAIQDMLDHSLSRLESRILSEVSELLPQMNSALTQFYKFSYELLARLEKIETDLGVEGKPMATELDLEAIQVRMEPAYSHADLEFVKNSVHEGKPDKNAVRQWVLSERRRKPELSYSVLAVVLNDAGIPTLSGREGWNRGTLRNIVVER
ncbi:MerR HTH family regulatory protein [Desulfonatronum zhilinae]|nr:MerR HTH family regulatory protein [Desulfonatronum zhilinae]